MAGAFLCCKIVVMPHQDQIDSVRDVYNQIGTEFSASRAYIWPDLKPFLEHVPDFSSILDIGCGNGRLLLGLPKNVRYTGLDISSVLIREATKNHPQARFIEGDLTRKEIWKEFPQFDYIFCIAVIHHLPTRHDQLFLLQQIKKHLKPGGQCLITAWNLWQPKLLKHHLSLKSLSLKLKMKNLKYLSIPFQGQSRFHFAHTKPYLEGLIREAGLDLKVTRSARNYLISSNLEI